MDILIATDIDGTLTDQSHDIPTEVCQFLEEISAKGADLLFVTGRPFQRSLLHLEKMPFPYLLAVYNGSLIFKMPERVIVHRNYLDCGLVEQVAEMCEGEETDVVIYGGYEHGDLCYFRPDRFSAELLKFLEHRQEYLNERWVAVGSFDDVPVRRFPSAKCFGTRENLTVLKAKMTELEVIVPIITDPVNNRYCVAQITHKEAHKGSAIGSARELNPKKAYRVIACGDDYNDLEMLREADVAVVMETAPRELLDVADVIAPKNGIVKGIKEAMKRLNG